MCVNKLYVYVSEQVVILYTCMYMLGGPNILYMYRLVYYVVMLYE
jgi:hypothetical protein